MTELIFYAKKFSLSNMTWEGKRLLISLKSKLEEEGVGVLDFSVNYYPDVERGIGVYMFKVNESIKKIKSKIFGLDSRFLARAQYYGAQEIDWHIK